VRLFFDQNLSPRLVLALGDVFPDSVHVREVGMARAIDDQVWTHALDEGLLIVSKDADFHQRAFLSAPPPKVIWIRLGNCTTAEIEKLLRDQLAAIQLFVADPHAAFLALG